MAQQLVGGGEAREVSAHAQYRFEDLGRAQQEWSNEGKVEVIWNNEQSSTRYGIVHLLRLLQGADHGDVVEGGVATKSDALR
jgi:hypothetical protein